MTEEETKSVVVLKPRTSFGESTVDADGFMYRVIREDSIDFGDGSLTKAILAESILSNRSRWVRITDDENFIILRPS